MTSPTQSQYYRDAELYDFLEGKIGQKDIEFWEAMAKRFGGPVLELMCGTGRVSIPLSLKGYEVTGIDLSPEMLARAREKARERGARVEFILKDASSFVLKRKFKLIIIPYNSFFHLLDREAIESALASVKRHLAKNGRFLIDVFNPKLEMLVRDPKVKHTFLEYEDPRGKGRVVMSEMIDYNRATQVLHSRWFKKIGRAEPEPLLEVSLRIIFPAELDAILHYNGFEIEQKYGGFDLAPFKPDSRKQICVCAKK